MTENKSWWSNFILAPKNGTIRFPFMQIVFGPYVLFIDKFKVFAYIGGAYALLISLIYVLGGQSLFCSYKNFAASQMCAYDSFLSIGSRLIVFAIISCYCVRYYKAVWMQQPLTFRAMFAPQKTDLYSLAALALLILLNAIAMLSWYLLSIREPNPDWRIELTYFGIVATGFLVPFVLLRFYCVLAYVWQGEKLPSLWQIWQVTRGNNLRLLIAVALCFLLVLFGLSAILKNLNFMVESGSFCAVLAGEFIYNAAELVLISCFVNFCGIQKFFLTERNKDEKNNLD